VHHGACTPWGDLCVLDHAGGVCKHRLKDGALARPCRHFSRLVSWRGFVVSSSILTAGHKQLLYVCRASWSS
jgi:hypothetical protein